MESEKENVNVVIVPENILQAIKNSSNLNLDVGDALLLSNPQSNDDIGDNTEASEAQNITNGNVWVMLPSDSLSISSNFSLPHNSSTDNTSLLQNLSEVNDSATTSVPLSNLCSQPQNIFDYKQQTSNDSGFSSLYANEVSMQTASSAKVGTSSLNSDDDGLNSDVNSIADTSFTSEKDYDLLIYVPRSNQAGTDNYFVFNTPLKLNTNKSVELKHRPIKPFKTPGCIEQSFLTNSAAVSNKTSVNQSAETAAKCADSDSGKELYRCDVENCDETFTSPAECRKHKTVFHGKKKIYKCKYANCMWSFSTPYKLRRHLESHYKRKPYSCTFPGCNAVFSNDYNQRAHLKLHTTINPNRICKICGELTANKRSLASHMRKAHDQPCEFLCNICKRQFSTLAALVIHKRSHNPPNEYECPVCEKKFVKQYYLKMHLYIHTGDKPHKCEVCNCGFATLSRLNRHSLLHKERSYECTVENCDKKFYRAHHLVQHMQRKHDADACSINSALRLHSNKTTKDYGDSEYFVCEWCGMKCLTAHGLKKHKKKCAHSSLPLEENVDDERIGDFENKKDRTEDSTQKIGNESIIVEINSYNDDDCSLESDVGENDLVIEENPNQSTYSSSNSLLTRACTVSSKATEKLIEGMDPDWTPPLVEPDDLGDSAHTAPYLTCSSNQSTSDVPLVPFMEDLDVLHDQAAQRFLRLDENMCVDPIADRGERLDQDVLDQYVIPSNNLKRAITVQINDNSVQCKEKEPDDAQAKSSLFEEDITLMAIEDAEIENFSGTTININDIH